MGSATHRPRSRGCWSCRRARSTRAWRGRWMTSEIGNGSAMSSELERRLEQALTDVPVEASSDAHDRARDAAVAMVLVTTGVTLAATGDRPFSDTATLTKPPQAARLHTGLLPRGARAFSILAGGRGWVAIPHRVLPHGAPRSAIAG